MSQTATYRVLVGDALGQLRTLPDASVQTCITSPPYWGLRNYGTGRWDGGNPMCDHKVRQDAHVESSGLDGGKRTVGHAQEGFGGYCSRCGAVRVDQQIGLEPTPEAYVGRLVEVFREVRRVLREDGTCWVNLGDSYAGSWGSMSYAGDDLAARRFGGDGQKIARPVTSRLTKALKSKDLVGIPWRVAFALQADGWWLRSDIVWEKPNPMPESVTDRPTRSHEYVFLMTKAQRYYYDADAIKEPAVGDHPRYIHDEYQAPGQPRHRALYLTDKQAASGLRTYAGFNSRWRKRQDPVGGNKYRARHHGEPGVFTGAPTRNKRDVWTIPTAQFPGTHFATFPEKLVEPMILAGCPVGGTVLDPFAGSGTTLAVANRLGRHAIGIELNPDYVRLIEARCAQAHWVLTTH